MIKISKIIGFFLIFAGILIPLSQFTYYELKNTAEVKLTTAQINHNDYYAILEIAKINLKKELYPLGSANNHVEKNILVHEKSIFPGNKRSHLILAAHSGYGANAYFKDLYQLELYDQIKLYYASALWLYEIIEIEYQAKTGLLYLKNDNENMLTLITCTQNDSTKQTIYYAALKDHKKL